MRARNIKPGFFKNEDLAECSPWARLCFAGLWTLADRDGRLEDRPKRIKAELFAFDAVDVDPLLGELLSFEVVTGRDGRKEAVRVQRSKRRPDAAVPVPAPKVPLQGAAYHQRRQLQRRLRWASVCAALLLALGTVVWLDMSRANTPAQVLQKLALAWGH